MLFKVQTKEQAEALCVIAAFNEYEIHNVKHIRIMNCVAGPSGISMAGNEEDYFELEILE
jgi:hypothetical protein